MMTLCSTLDQPASNRHSDSLRADPAAPPRLQLPAPTLLHVESDRMFGHFFAAEARKWKEVAYLGLAGTGDAAVEHCRTYGAELVLMDLQLPDTDGCELIARLHRCSPVPRIVVLTANVTQLTLTRLAATPVAGLISKLSCDGITLRTALREAIAGRTYVSEELRAQVAEFRRSRDAFYKILSDRELEVLPFFGAGWDDLQIAERLGISAATVKRHRATVLSKLDLHSTPALMRWAALAGFVSYRAGSLRLHHATDTA